MLFSRVVYRLALFVALAGLPPVANADDSTPEAKARTLFESGQSAREAKDFDAALRFFRESHETYASSTFDALVNMADCENALGKTAVAYLHYDEYLRNVKGQTDRTPEIAAIMAGMVKTGPWIRIARRDLLDAKAILKIDGVFLGPVSGKIEDIPAELGNHTVTILEPGQAERTIVVKVDAGKHALVDFRPKASPNGENGFQVVGPESPKPLPHWVLPVGIVVGGAGSLTTLMMGTGFAFGAMKTSKTNPQESDRLSTEAMGLLIAGGVLTTATVVMIVVNQKKQKDVAMLPIVAPGHGGVALIGRF